MISSVSGPDEPNPAQWLTTRTGKMELDCPFCVFQRYIFAEIQGSKLMQKVSFNSQNIFGGSKKIFSVGMELDDEKIESVNENENKDNKNVDEFERS